MLPTYRSMSARAESGGREPVGVSRGWAQPKGIERHAGGPFRASSAASWWRVASSLAAAVVIAACGGEAALPEPGTGQGAKDVDAPTDVEGETSVDEPASGGVKAPGISRRAYPDAPYGTTEGAIIEDLEFFGWKDPVAAEFDVAKGSTVRLSEFYNPDAPAGQGTEFIMLNAVTVWCGVCRTEYQHLKDQGTYAAFAPRGLEIVGVLFEDNNGDPSTYADLTNWTRNYSVKFPFLNDPGFKTGVYFDKSATPMNMLIDARTMEIVLVMTGYNPLIYDEIDKLLTERGR